MAVPLSTTAPLGFEEAIILRFLCIHGRWCAHPSAASVQACVFMALSLLILSTPATQHPSAWHSARFPYISFPFLHQTITLSWYPLNPKFCAGDVHTGCGQFIWADLGGCYSHYLTSEILQLIISDGLWTGNYFKCTARPYPSLFIQVFMAYDCLDYIFCWPLDARWVFVLVII